MENKPKNPDAFPCDNKSEGYSGMTLRDYFAAKAMQGYISNPTVTQTLADNLKDER